jgi:hypothetical protein
LAIPSDLQPIAEQPDFEIRDVGAEINGLKHGAGFTVFVRRGRLVTLEGYSYDEPWPEAIGDFELRYHSEPRNLKLPDPSS